MIHFASAAAGKSILPLQMPHEVIKDGVYQNGSYADGGGIR
jgi:hypothetical protein